MGCERFVFLCSVCVDGRPHNTIAFYLHQLNCNLHLYYYGENTKWYRNFLTRSPLNLDLITANRAKMAGSNVLAWSGRHQATTPKWDISTGRIRKDVYESNFGAFHFGNSWHVQIITLRVSFLVRMAKRIAPIRAQHKTELVNERNGRNICMKRQQKHKWRSGNP